MRLVSFVCLQALMGPDGKGAGFGSTKGGACPPPLRRGVGFPPPTARQTVEHPSGSHIGWRPPPCRVLNSKCSDLSDLIAHKLKKTMSLQGKSTELVSYRGHTRFATSSLTTLDGCHPHQWTSPSVMSFWDGFRDKRSSSSRRTVENFITHNGDFDPFTAGTHSYDLSKVQAWLQRVLWTPMPSTVDSEVVAGLVDLLQTQGLWTLSVRYAFVFAGGHEDLDYDMPSLKEIEAVAHVLEAVFEAKVITENAGSNHGPTRSGVVTTAVDQLASDLPFGLDLESALLHEFMLAAVNTFFDNNLYHSVRLLPSNYKGSFGLSVSSSPAPATTAPCARRQIPRAPQCTKLRRLCCLRKRPHFDYL